ncbi:hypothetical protein DZB84_24445 [Bacillus sp. HNG]|uniref:hypothetical protein n=1 Tax=Bacillus sp. HNG TaxID=2293325 RepID=UPI000E2F08B8|nr:hypothetical protein [Bacillus sp. HNG]RFB09319.1 hypothetical protein DZB84_24445 [Bacillus sp. HNG]
MFRLEFVNSFTQEVIRQVEYQDKDKGYIDSLLSTLRSAKEDIILFDNILNPYTVRYLTHVVVRENDVKTFRVLFKVKPSNKEVKIKSRF